MYPHSNQQGPTPADKYISDFLAKQAQELGLGPTGDHPLGDISPSDQGGLNVAVGIVGDKVMVNLGTTVKWFAVTKEQAISFGQAIINMANQIPD
jgi:hypothetical protein